MEFRTVCKAQTSPLRLSPRRPLVFAGSCFSENICRRLRRALWPAYNFTGALYNPESIISALRLMLTGDEHSLPKDSLLHNSGLWHCWYLDSGFSDITPEGVERKFIAAARGLRKVMESGADLIITFGTAWVYRLISPEYLRGSEAFTVGNCHKIPSVAFSREKLSVEDICRQWIDFSDEIKERYPDSRLIFTLSPVRHIKDGFAGNSLSKATLRVAIDEMVEGMKPEAVYFPAYEILLDDLRDYRFYASDMLHPSDQAVEYIYERFIETFVDESDRQLLKAGEALDRAYRHRPIIPTEENLHRLKQNFNEKADALTAIWPEALLPEFQDCRDVAHDHDGDDRGDTTGRN